MKYMISLISALCFTMALPAQDTDFADWDKDGDGVIEHYEFAETFVDKFYDNWNPADKRGIIEEDFFQNSYASLDTDNDNKLSDEEWLVGYHYFYDGYVINKDMSLVDIDGDGSIEYTEYYDFIYDSDFFRDIDLDADQYISQYELADYAFDNWDLNGSGTLSRFEFNKFDWYYLDV